MYYRIRVKRHYLCGHVGKMLINPRLEWLTIVVIRDILSWELILQYSVSREKAVRMEIKFSTMEY